ncbi:PAS domain-containing protein [Gorillibacterium timonense]|uniref:PAS domain-containing protein n=1 Tax=Gorillibacterium timonense TaxID=1689269 RepID=UPI00071D4877|nr:ATP-binding protein [Gorillibacterium timonense]
METDVVRLVYSSFFRHAPYGISVINRKGIILQANEAFSVLCGIPVPELIGFPIFALTHHEDQWEEREKYRSFTVSDEVEILYEINWQLQDGSTRPMQVVLTKMDSTKNPTSWFLASYKDLSQAKKRDKLERQRRRRALAAEQAALAGCWEWSKNRIPSLYCSAGIYSILGMEPMGGELTGEQMIERLHPDDLMRFPEISKDKSFSANFRIRCMNDSFRLIRVSGEWICDEEDADSYWAGTFHDVTELEQAKYSVRQQQLLTMRIHDAFQDIVCLIHQDFTISGLSKSFYSLTGYSEEDVLTIPIEQIIPPEDIQFVRSHMNLSQGQPVTFRCRTRTGSILWLEAAILSMPEGIAPAGTYLLVARDHTEVKNIHEHALNSDKLTAVGGLAAGIAHEIRNPLTAIKGFIQLMKNGTVKEEFYEIILSELSRIDSIVKELLFLSKPHPVTYTVAELYPLLDHVITLINTQAILYQIEIEQHYQEGSMQLYCDENQIKQVLINLLKNAIEAMPSGGKITLKTDYNGANSVLIQITDQGIGISQENLEKIGQMFYSTKESGTGLGMMISHEIIRNHGGKMTLRSTQGVGTTVEITLPIIR